MYILVKTYQEDLSDGEEILCVTENLTKIRKIFKRYVRSCINENPEWIVDRKDSSYFYHYHPEETGDFTALEIKSFSGEEEYRRMREEECQRIIDELQKLVIHLNSSR